MDSAVVKLQGSANEVGYQHGDILKPKIDQFLKWFYTNLQKDFGISTKDLLSKAETYWSFIQNYSTNVAQEIAGIAEGSGRTLNEIVFLNSYYELYFRQTMPPKCTSFAATGRVTMNGETYVAQNWDDLAEWHREGFIPIKLRIKRKIGPELIGFTFPGVLIAAGMNSSGVSLCSNTIYCEEKKVGVPVYAICAEILQQKTIDDAINSITRADRAESLNYVIGDPTGKIFDIEATPRDTDISQGQSLHHTNHFLSRKFEKKKDIVRLLMSDTLVRDNRMRGLLEQNTSRIDIEMAKDMLRDHTNYPNSICRHEGSKFNLVTAVSLILVPSEREVWLADGNPCSKDYTKYLFG